jgi:hypothetical protein
MPLINVIPTLYTNVKLYGALGDGATDDTTAIAAAITAVAAQPTGGTVFFPPGTYISGSQTLATNVHIKGAGIEATIIKLKNTTNADLFSASVGSINLSAAFGVSSTGGISEFSISDLTLDGNKANQSGTSYPLRFYGYGFILLNLRIRNGLTGGVLIDWNGGTNGPNYNTLDNIEAQIVNVKIHDNGGVGLQMGGPHDSHLTNVLIYDTGTNNLHFAPNATAMLCTHVHGYSSTHAAAAVAFLVEAGQCQFTNCQAEGSDLVQVVFLANGCQWRAGRIFTASLTASGIQIGQAAGNTPYAGMILQSAGVTTAVSLSGYDVDTHIDSCEGANGSVWFANDGGGYVFADVFNATGKYIGGARNATTQTQIYGRGLTPAGTLAQDGGTILNGAAMRGGTLGVTKSGTVATIITGGTITTLSVGMARVTEAGAITGVILQGGSFDGQMVWVVNEANFTIAFAVAGTSHVADGATLTIPGLAARLFVWDTTTSLWYRAA